MVRLNVGCGRNPLPGWINIDVRPLAGVDVVADFENCQNQPLPIEDAIADEFYVGHVIEHVRNPLPLMQELHRIARPDALMTIRCPYGSSDDAFEDPTHVRQYFLNSFGYFSQPYYWRADYGYRGDWDTRRIVLSARRDLAEGLPFDEVLAKVMRERNVVVEMVAELRAVKPIRAPLKELQTVPAIDIQLV